jgi:hypothetical protein
VGLKWEVVVRVDSESEVNMCKNGSGGQSGGEIGSDSQSGCKI